ncbi:MAG: hypothetical protein AAF485_29820, partial [Chloroflexota bacterium]
FWLGCQNKPESLSFASTLERLDIPVGMTGRIIFVEERGQPNYRIAALDLATGAIDTIFAIPSGGFVYQFEATPNHQYLLMAYTAPAETGQSPFDRSGLYLLDLNQPTKKPQLLLGGDRSNVYYFDPTLSSDGNTVIYVKSAPAETPAVTINRHALDTGEDELLVGDATWPRLSPNQDLVSHITFDSKTGQQRLQTTNLQTKQSTFLLDDNAFYDVDRPLFSPDGAWIYFVALEPPEAYLWGKLWGVQIAQAHGNHDIPGNWWRIPTQGGTPEPITRASETFIAGAFSPDGQTLGLSSRSGLYLVDAEGGEMMQIVKARTIRHIVWLP